MDLENIANCLEYDTLITYLNKYLITKVDMKLSINDAQNLYARDSKKYIYLVIKSALYGSLIKVTAEYNDCMGKQCFLYDFRNFMKSNIKNIDIKPFLTNTFSPIQTAQFFNQYVFFENNFLNKDVFLMSLYFKQYKSSELDLIVSLNVFSPKEETLFWKTCAKLAIIDDIKKTNCSKKT